MSFEIALSGINAVNSQLGNISNNIANSGTYGFKSSRDNFSAVYAGSQATGVEVGSVTQSIGRGGNVVATGRALDAAIQGGGFFMTRDATGSISYTRVGVFNIDKNGMLEDAFGRKVQGYAAVEGAPAGTLGNFGDIALPTGLVPAKASSQLKYSGNLSAGWTVPSAAFDAANPATFNGSSLSTVYDSLGNKHIVTQYFVKSASDIKVHYAVDGNIVGSPSSLTFDTNGKLTAPTAPVTLALGTPAGASALSIKIDYAGSTQFAGETTTSVNSADGFAAGTRTGLRIEDDGSLVATYSNGERRSVATIALATFPNENGLTAVSETSWEESSASGSPLLSVPGSGGAGKLVASSLEKSNVDLTGELVNLMTAQRNYQANTKVISTQNQVVQALMQAV